MDKLISLFGILLLFEQVYLQEVLSTNYTCANSIAELYCPKEYSIFISRIEYKYTSGQCIDYDDTTNYLNNDDSSLDDCIGIEPQSEYYSTRCNGQQNCYVQVKKKTQKIGFSGTNCDFESNMANIFYACIPNKVKEPYKSFDICDNNGPETILGLENGFIHSPYFPDYYGNNHDCYMNIAVPENKRLVVYLLKMNMEGYGMFREPKDFLHVNNDKRLFGSATLPHIIFNGSNRERVNIKFKTDWITTSKLDNPKGFLLFFALYTITNQPITTTILPTTTTSPTTTSTTTPSTTTPVIIVPELKEVNEKFLAAISQRREKIEESDRFVSIIIALVCTIGFLVVIIFGLLFMYRRKQIQEEEDTIYSDGKTIDDSTISAKKSFSSKLRNIYHRINQTLSDSNNVLKKEIKLDEQNNETIKTFNVNEYIQDDKFEKVIPIDSFKMFKNEIKKSNIELEQARRNENPYVTNPVTSLKIVQIDFENNLPNINNSKENEIYQSIKELNKIDEDGEPIYSTPSNICLVDQQKNHNETEA